MAAVVQLEHGHAERGVLAAEHVLAPCALARVHAPRSYGMPSWESSSRTLKQLPDSGES